MQPTTWKSVLSLLAFAAPCKSYRGVSEVVHRHQLSAAAARASRAEWVALMEVEADDRQFWASELGNLEATLLQLQTSADSALALVQAGNVTNATSQATLLATIANMKHNLTSKNATSIASLNATNTNQMASTNGTSSVVTVTHNVKTASRARRASPLNGIKINLNPKSVADLAPALAMLKALYEDGKERIAELNAREKQSKQRFDAKQAEHVARLKTIDERFKNHTLSAEFRTNETRDENRMYSYWERVRERQHRQFHTSLKIQHGTMEREKLMIDAYEKTMAGTANRAQVSKELAKVAGVPEVVLVQVAWRSAAAFFRGALAEVRAARAELRRGVAAPAAA